MTGFAPMAPQKAKLRPPKKPTKKPTKKPKPPKNPIEHVSRTDKDKLEAIADEIQSRRIVVVAGAGISTSAGIPDFRSEGGLYENAPGQSGEDFFHQNTWNDPQQTATFLKFATNLRRQALAANPTQCHLFLRALRDGGKLVRCYSQNIDLLEAKAGLSTQLELGAGSKDRFSRRPRIPVDSDVRGVECVLLHGSLELLRCCLCEQLFEWDDERQRGTFAGERLECSGCVSEEAERERKGKRNGRRGNGWFRPDIVMYGEPNPDGDQIDDIIEHDLGLGADMLIILGTSLKVRGTKALVKDFAKEVHSVHGKVVFVNLTKPKSSEWDGDVDYWVEWEVDAWVQDLARRIPALWSIPLLPLVFKAIGDDENLKDLPRRRPEDRLAPLPLFPQPLIATEQWDSHCIARPDGEKGGRGLFEPLDFPGWGKHPLVAGLAKADRQGMVRFQHIMDGLYGFDGALHDRAWLTDDHVTAALCLAVIGLDNVLVASYPITIGHEGPPAREAKAESPCIAKQQARARSSAKRIWTKEWRVKARYFVSLVNFNRDHWGVLVWDKELKELYYFDALAEGRTERIDEIEAAWTMFLEADGDEANYYLIAPEQAPQGRWECGLLAAANVANFFRDEAAVGRRVPLGDGLLSGARVRSWGSPEWSEEDGATKAGIEEQLDKTIATWRAAVYNFFGQPANIPLNAKRPWKVGPPTDTEWGEVERGETLWNGERADFWTEERSAEWIKKREERAKVTMDLYEKGRRVPIGCTSADWNLTKAVEGSREDSELLLIYGQKVTRWPFLPVAESLLREGRTRACAAKTPPGLTASSARTSDTGTPDAVTQMNGRSPSKSQTSEADIPSAFDPRLPNTQDQWPLGQQLTADPAVLSQVDASGQHWETHAQTLIQQQRTQLTVPPQVHVGREDKKANDDQLSKDWVTHINRNTDHDTHINPKIDRHTHTNHSPPRTHTQASVSDACVWGYFDPASPGIANMPFPTSTPVSIISNWKNMAGQTISHPLAPCQDATDSAALFLDTHPDAELDADDLVILTDDEAQHIESFRAQLRLCKGDTEKYGLCLQKRNELLEQYASLTILVATCEQVMSAECSEYKDRKNKIQAAEPLPTKPRGGDEEQWGRFLNIAADGSRIKSERLTTLKTLEDIWGRDVVQHYQWASKGERYLNKLRTAARAVRKWNEAVTGLNRSILQRSQCFQRRSVQHSINPIEEADLKNLREWSREDPRPYEGLAINDLPDVFGFDKFGLVVRKEHAAVSTPDSTSITRSSALRNASNADTTWPPEPNGTTQRPAILEQSGRTDSDMHDVGADTFLAEIADGAARTTHDTMPPQVIPAPRGPDASGGEDEDGDGGDEDGDGGEEDEDGGDPDTPQPTTRQLRCRKVAAPTVPAERSAPRNYRSNHKPKGPCCPPKVLHSFRLLPESALEPPKGLTVDDLCAEHFAAIYQEKFAAAAKAQREKRAFSASDLDQDQDQDAHIRKRPHIDTDTSRSDGPNASPQYDIAEAKLAIEKARKRLGKEIGNPEARFNRQRGSFLKIIKDCDAGKPITPDQYRAGMWDRYSFIYCTTEDARSILREGMPKLPIVIPNEGFQRLNVDRFLRKLEAQPTIDVHDFALERDTVEPVKMRSADAITKFKTSPLPANFLNLRAIKDNPVPPALVGLDDFRILADLRETPDNGKAVLFDPDDLSQCTQFHILGKTGAFHFPHIDHHGVLTTIFCDDGEKLWFTWPGVPLGDLETWARRKETDPPKDWPCVGLHLRPGSLLIQPLATLHAPFSLTNVLMTGTMHWDSRQMVEVMQLSTLERSFPAITNEAPAKEFRRKVEYIEQLWKGRNGVYTWGSDELLSTYSKLVKEYPDIAKRPSNDRRRAIRNG